MGTASWQSGLSRKMLNLKKIIDEAGYIPDDTERAWACASETPAGAHLQAISFVNSVALVLRDSGMTRRQAERGVVIDRETPATDEEISEAMTSLKLSFSVIRRPTVVVLKQMETEQFKAGTKHFRHHKKVVEAMIAADEIVDEVLWRYMH